MSYLSVIAIHIYHGVLIEYWTHLSQQSASEALKGESSSYIVKFHSNETSNNKIFSIEDQKNISLSYYENITIIETKILQPRLLLVDSYFFAIQANESAAILQSPAKKLFNIVHWLTFCFSNCKHYKECSSETRNRINE